MNDCPPERLVRVEAPHYTAGLCIEQDAEGRWYVTDAANILGWTIGKRFGEVLDYFVRCRYTVRAAPTWRRISK